MPVLRPLLRSARGPYHRLRGALRLHGVFGLLQLVPQNLAYLLRRRRRHQRGEIDEFDRRFGVETAARRPVSTLDLPQAAAIHAVRYEPVARLADYLAALDIAFDRYTFVDYGCGKGRALLMASDQPFAKIIGVEYSAQLAAIARRNISIYTNPNQRCRAIEVVEGDAARFAPPHSACVFFLYNPFDEVILRQVVQRMRRTRCPAGPADHLIYVDPRHRACLDADPGWEAVADHQSWVVYRATGADGAPSA